MAFLLFSTLGLLLVMVSAIEEYYGYDDADSWLQLYDTFDDFEEFWYSDDLWDSAASLIAADHSKYEMKCNAAIELCVCQDQLDGTMHQCKETSVYSARDIDDDNYNYLNYENDYSEDDTSLKLENFAREIDGENYNYFELNNDDDYNDDYNYFEEEQEYNDYDDYNDDNALEILREDLARAVEEEYYDDYAEEQELQYDEEYYVDDEEAQDYYIDDDDAALDLLEQKLENLEREIDEEYDNNDDFALENLARAIEDEYYDDYEDEEQDYNDAFEDDDYFDALEEEEELDDLIDYLEEEEDELHELMDDFKEEDANYDEFF